LGSLSRRGWVSRNFASTSAKYASASQKVESYNDLISFEILGAPAPTSSTGTAMAAMERLIAQLPAGIGYEWTGQSYEVPIEPKDECPVFGLAGAERTAGNPPCRDIRALISEVAAFDPSRLPDYRSGDPGTGPTTPHRADCSAPMSDARDRCSPSRKRTSRRSALPTSMGGLC